MKQPIIIYGGGKLGNQVFFHLEKEGYKVLGFADDTQESQSVLKNGKKILGGIDYVISNKENFSVALAIGYNNLVAKQNLVTKLLLEKVQLINFIHSAAYVESPEKMGQGNFVMPGAVIDQNVVLGDGNYIDMGVKIGEETIVGNGNYFSNGVLVGGSVNCGNSNFIGMGTIVVNDVKIGDSNKINAGSLIYKSLKSSKLLVEIRTQKEF